MHRIKRTMKPYLVTNTPQHFTEKGRQKCTELREQRNLTWLQIHHNTLPEPVGERHHDVEGAQTEHEVYRI